MEEVFDIKILEQYEIQFNFINVNNEDIFMH